MLLITMRLNVACVDQRLEHHRRKNELLCIMCQENAIKNTRAHHR